MARAVAFGLAVVVCAAIFGLALLAVHWFAGSVGFWATVEARWFPAALIAVNSVIFTSGVGIALLYRRRMEKRATAEATGLLPVAERFRREVGRGKPKL